MPAQQPRVGTPELFGLSDAEAYAFWSNAARSLGSGIDVRVREIDYVALRRLYQQWRQLRRFFTGAIRHPD